jgi:hypothetical protein
MNQGKMLECDLKPLEKKDPNRPGYFLFQCQREGCGRIISSKWNGPPSQMHYQCTAGRNGLLLQQQRQALESPVDGEEEEADAKSLGLKVSDLRHWWRSIRRWRLAGKPTRTDDQVAHILTICPECEHYTDEWGGRCKLCRCRVNASKMAIANKARMGTEKCPAGKW